VEYGETHPGKNYLKQVILLNDVSLVTNKKNPHRLCAAKQEESGQRIYENHCDFYSLIEEEMRSASLFTSKNKL
jgi:hypothetical protein